MSQKNIHVTELKVDEEQKQSNTVVIIQGRETAKLPPKCIVT